MATTMKNTLSSAKKNIFGKSALRCVGFICAFIGVMLLYLKANVTNTILQILAIFILLLGVLLTSSNFKMLINKNNTKKKDSTIYMLLGLLMIFLAIILFLFGNQITTVVNLLLGIVIAVYGLALTIYLFISVKVKKNWFFVNLIIALLLLTSGILISLLYQYYSQTYLLVVGIFATTSGGLSMILY